MLDLGNNKVSVIENLESLVLLEELWMNRNAITSFEALSGLKGLPSVHTAYFEYNPIQADPLYRKKVLLEIPTLKQDRKSVV